MVSEKGIVKQFDLVVYPVGFVVAIGDVEKEINNLYKPYEKDYNWIAPPEDNYLGATYRIKNKKTGCNHTMIWISKKEECTCSTIAHECTHAALEIYRYTGSEVSLDNQEPFCYLLGNLVRLAVGCFYEIPGIQPPVVSHDAFVNPEKPKK